MTSFMESANSDRITIIKIDSLDLHSEKEKE